MATIHPTAIIAPGAELAGDVFVGPYCTIGADCVLSSGVRLHSHVVLEGRTSIGPDTQIYPFASIGGPPQDLKYAGEPSRLVVGARNRIREYVTMNPGTRGGGMVTQIGDDNLFMIGAHVAHDCCVGNHVIMANNASIAGHVTVGDYAVLGGLSAVHQFVRIGAHAMVGGMAAVERDIIPFGSVAGPRARLLGLNIIGLKRRNFTRGEISRLLDAYDRLFDEKGGETLNARLNEVSQDFSDSPQVMQIVDFLQHRASRGLTQPGGE